MASSADSQKPQRGYLPPQNAEEQLLQRRVDELCRAAQHTGRARFTDFLSDRQQQLAQAALNRIDWPFYRWEGGWPGAERKMLCILPDEGEGEEAPFCCVRLSAQGPGAALAHRDCLGALMALGLERESMGDIFLPGEKEAFVFAKPAAADVICRELHQAGHTTVRAGLCEMGELPFTAAQAEPQRKTASVASLRLDAVLAAMLHGSREQAAQRIRAGRVEINHLAVSSTSASLYAGDKITVRGEGRFCLEKIGGKSRKDRVFIQYYQS